MLCSEAAGNPGPGVSEVQRGSGAQSRFPGEVTGDPGGDPPPLMSSGGLFISSFPDF